MSEWTLAAAPHGCRRSAGQVRVSCNTPENVPYREEPLVSGVPNLFAGLDLNQLPQPVQCGGRGFLGLQFASLISIQVFQVFVRFRELAPNDHRKRRHSQWQEIDSEHRQPHVLAISEQPLLPEWDLRLFRPQRRARLQRFR